MSVPTLSAACWIAIALSSASSAGQAQPVASTESAATESAAAKSAKTEQPCPHARGATASADREPIELNSANAEQLERLPGIGPTRARAILELRARMKRFTRVEDLLRVRGIGRATFRKLRPLVRLDASP